MGLLATPEQLRDIRSPGQETTLFHRNQLYSRGYDFNYMPQLRRTRPAKTARRMVLTAPPHLLRPQAYRRRLSLSGRTDSMEPCSLILPASAAMRAASPTR